MKFHSYGVFIAPTILLIHGYGHGQQTKYYLYHLLLANYLTTALVYIGLGYPALFVKGIKSLITTAAHSSIPWDKPFYEKKWLHPVAWVLERFISTPATHHAHHAASNDDGIGHYKGNFGNMFFIWDVIFGTGIITRNTQQPMEFNTISRKNGMLNLCGRFSNQRRREVSCQRMAPW